MIGNSRLHWALFQGDDFIVAWHTPHCSMAQVQMLIEQQWVASAWPCPVPPALAALVSDQRLPLWVASVVPDQTQLWQAYPVLHLIETQAIPMTGLYASLGCDRALALWGAGTTWGWPMLVIDGGTALTLTAATGDRHLWGGAILPGLGLQLRTLAQDTAALPAIQRPTEHWPSRWAKNTTEAIQSGVLYTLLAGLQDYLQDWWRCHPDGRVAITGGDGDLLYHGLIRCKPAIEKCLRYEPDLIFKGIHAYRAWLQA